MSPGSYNYFDTPRYTAAPFELPSSQRPPLPPVENLPPTYYEPLPVAGRAATPVETIAPAGGDTAVFRFGGDARENPELVARRAAARQQYADNMAAVRAALGLGEPLNPDVPSDVHADETKRNLNDLNPDFYAEDPAVIGTRREARDLAESAAELTVATSGLAAAVRP